MQEIRPACPSPLAGEGGAHRSSDGRVRGDAGKGIALRHPARHSLSPPERDRVRAARRTPVIAERVSHALNQPSPEDRRLYLIPVLVLVSPAHLHLPPLPL